LQSPRQRRGKVDGWTKGEMEPLIDAGSFASVRRSVRSRIRRAWMGPAEGPQGAQRPVIVAAAVFALRVRSAKWVPLAEALYKSRLATRSTARTDHGTASCRVGVVGTYSRDERDKVVTAGRYRLLHRHPRPADDYRLSGRCRKSARRDPIALARALGPDLSAQAASTATPR